MSHSRTDPPLVARVVPSGLKATDQTRDVCQVRAATPFDQSQADATVERARVSIDGLPHIGRVGELPMDTQALAVVGQPVTQPRPTPDEGLVGDLDTGVIKRDESCAG